MNAVRQPSAVPKKLRARAEKLLDATRGEIAQMPVDDVQKLVHELQVHQVELEMQNDELRRAQLGLAQSADRYADLFDFAPVAYLTLTTAGEILEANLAAGELLGLERSRLIHQKFSHFIPAPAQDIFYLLCQRVFESDTRQSAELELVNAQARRVTVQIEAVRAAASPRKRCRFCITDISERKRNQEQLEHSFHEIHNLKTALDEHAIVAILNPQGKITYANDKFCTVSKFAREELLGQDYRRISSGFHPQAFMDDLWTTITQGRVWKGELKNQAQDDSFYWVDTTIVPFLNAAGKIRQHVVIHTNITERKRTEERLAQLSRAQAILGAVNHAIVHIPDRQKLLDEICGLVVKLGGFKLVWIGMVTPEGEIKPVAKAGMTDFLENLQVMTQDVPAGRGPCGTAIRENRPDVIENLDVEKRVLPWRDRLRQFGLNYHAAFPIRIDGKVVGSIQVYAARANFFNETELTLLTQVSDDISFALTTMATRTAHEQAETLLRRSERNLSCFFNQSPIGLEWLSASGAVLQANQAQLNLLGYSADEYLGRHFTEFCAEPTGGIEMLMRLATKTTIQNYRLLRRCKDGTLRCILVDAVSVWSANQLQYSSVFSRDITDRVALEKEILSVGERERRRIFQDLHDGLGQLLVGAAYMASRLRKHLALKSLPEEVRQAGRILEVVNEGIAQTRSLARGLHPVEPEPDGLMVALKSLAARTKEMLGIRCKFNCRRPVLIQDNMVATHLYRIAQEAVTNAIKHGKPSRIEIGLTETSTRLMLAIRDDGTGLSARRRKKSGMGLRIMNYRAGMIGGSLGLQKIPGGGTAVVCTVHLSGKGEIKLPFRKKLSEKREARSEKREARSKEQGVTGAKELIWQNLLNPPPRKRRRRNQKKS